MGCKTGEQVAPLEVVTNQVAATCIGSNFVTGWQRPLYRFQIWPPGGANCLSYKNDHQIVLKIALMGSSSTGIDQS